MNLGQLRAACYANLGTDAGDGLIVPASVNLHINRAVHDIEQESDWPWLETSETVAIVAGTDQYTPGAVGGSWLRTRWVEDDTQKVIEWYSRQELADRWRISTVGKPVEFSVYQDKIWLRPVPDQAYTYTHFYQKFEADLVNDSDTTLMPATYHSGLVDYATYLAFKSSRETERANLAFQSYTDRMKRMKERAKRRVDLPGKVRNRPGGWL